MCPSIVNLPLFIWSFWLLNPSSKDELHLLNGNSDLVFNLVFLILSFQKWIDLSIIIMGCPMIHFRLRMSPVWCSLTDRLYFRRVWSLSAIHQKLYQRCSSDHGRFRSFTIIAWAGNPFWWSSVHWECYLFEPLSDWSTQNQVLTIGSRPSLKLGNNTLDVHPDFKLLLGSKRFQMMRSNSQLV